MLIHSGKATNERCEEGAGKNGHREDCDCETAGAVVEHVRKDCSHDGERTRPEDTTKKSTDQDCLQVLSYCASNREYGETEHGDDQWKFPAFQL